MKINFRESLAATLIVSGVVFSSCVDSDKNFYDPNYRAQNPMGNISAPNGFDWLLFSSINLNVKVNDTFNGQYHYTVEVFDNNPVISPDATLLTKGFGSGLHYRITRIQFDSDALHSPDCSGWIGINSCVQHRERGC